MTAKSGSPYKNLFREKLNILLPGRLNDTFPYIFYEYFGCKVLWDNNESNLEEMVRDNEFDIAFEWQYGHDDHTVLDLVKKYNKKAKVVVLLNWNGQIPADYKEVGYFTYMDTPFKLADLDAFFLRILEGRQSEESI